MLGVSDSRSNRKGYEGGRFYLKSLFLCFIYDSSLGLYVFYLDFFVQTI